MSKQSKRPRRTPAALRGSRNAASPPRFAPVPVRARHDGWTPAKQVAFLQALAETACVDEACRAVGMSARSAYTLRARADASSFRQAWEITLDYALDLLADAMVGRAIRGVATPIFYQGEQIGEKRRYDERLGLFLLRTRRPDRYGPGRDRLLATRDDPDGAAKLMNRAIDRTFHDGLAALQGRRAPVRPPLRTEMLAATAEATEAACAAEELLADTASRKAWEATLRGYGTLPPVDGSGSDVSRSS